MNKQPINAAELVLKGHTGLSRYKTIPVALTKLSGWLKDVETTGIGAGGAPRRRRTRAMQGTIEKGVDTPLATDLTQGALDDLFDTAVLISAKGNFARPVELVKTAPAST